MNPTPPPPPPPGWAKAALKLTSKGPKGSEATWGNKEDALVSRSPAGQRGVFKGGGVVYLKKGGFGEGGSMPAPSAVP